MIKVRVFKYYRQAKWEFENFKKNNDEVMGTDMLNMSLLLRNGDELHFVPVSSFEKWRMGRKFEIEQWDA